MNRRSFLGLLGASTAAMVLDPELALWKPGAKTFFLPPVTRVADPGISIRFLKQFDHSMDAVGYPVRLDVLYGMSVLQPTLACRIVDSTMRDIEEASGVSPMEPVLASAVKDLANRIDAQALAFHQDAFAFVSDPLTRDGEIPRAVLPSQLLASVLWPPDRWDA